MKRVFSSIFLLMAFGFLLVSNAKAGEREDKLVKLASTGDVNGVRNLLDQGVDVNAKDSHGSTALDGALSFHSLAPDGNYIGVVRLLVARGADINAPIWLGFTPLTVTALNGEATIVRILIDKGADVNRKDKIGNTALMRANEVLEKGNLKGHDNSFKPIYRPLTSAEKQAYTDIVQMLKAAGAK